MSLLSHLARASLDSFTKADICHVSFTCTMYSAYVVTALSLSHTHTHTHSAQAINHLLMSYSPSNTEDIHKTVLNLLITPPRPSLLTPSHRPLITASLSLLYQLNIISMCLTDCIMKCLHYIITNTGPTVVIVGMVASVEERVGGGGGVESELVDWLERCGVVDPYCYFTRHLSLTASSHQVSVCVCVCDSLVQTEPSHIHLHVWCISI